MSNVALAKDGGLFQSNLWKEFQKSLGKEVFETPYFWGVVQYAPLLGSYGEVSRGPLTLPEDRGELQGLIEKVRKENNLSLLRVEPQEEDLVSLFSQLSFSFRKAPFDVQPKEILLLPLAESEDEMFSHMKSKTRYNIRLAQKKGVVVRPAVSQEEKNAFLDILIATARRKGVAFHTRAYYQTFIDFFSQEKGQTFLAFQDGKVLAGAALVFSGQTAYYVHGGSSDEGRNYMAPHLLQWESICFAKKAGCLQYDFGGVAKKENVSGKNWTGITRFKEGFAPHIPTTLLPGTYDIIFSPLRYAAYQLISKLKKRAL